jgi:N-acetyl-anhydromuramyl-L-alanine amidase AmpD
MVAQLRPTRLDVTDRYPMLGFTIRTDSPPRVAEVVLASHPSLLTGRQGRTAANFFSSREQGLLTIDKREAVYVVPPEVMARLVSADKLYFALATATPGKDDWTVDLLPSEASPFVSLKGLTDRALKRVRMFPSRRTSRRYGATAPAPGLEWAGDRAQPGMAPAGGPAATNGAPAAAPASGAPAPAPAPANVPYDDGFGPLPPLAPSGPAEASAPSAPATANGTPAAQSYARGLEAEVDPENMGIDEAVTDEASPPRAMALDARPRALTAAEYSGVTRIMPSPAYNEGRRGQAIDRIVIHITGAGQTPYIGSWFTREEANSSAHYMVDQNGDILQFVREQDTAWHARGANRRSIGIEHVAVQRGGATYGSTHYPYTPPSAAEYAASAALVAHLCRKYNLTPDRTTIIGHREADPGTSHSVCPDGAWDWDAYMALVATAYAALAVGGAIGGAVGAVGGAVGRVVGTVRDALGFARGLEAEVDPENMGIESSVTDEASAPQAMALGARPRALTAAEYSGVTRIMPSPAYNEGRRGQAIDRIVIHITGAPQSRYIGSWFTREEANSSAHYMVDQNGEVLQFVREQDTAWHARGANRRSIGIEHVAIQRGGATYGTTHYAYLPPTDAEYRASAELVAHLCRKYGLTPDRTTIIGHREADPGTSHSVCPDGAWDWDAYMVLVAACYAALPAAGVGGAQGLGYARGLEADPEAMGIDGPAYAEDVAPAVAAALDLTVKDYDRTARIEPSPAFTAGRSGQAIDRIVIHITDAPTTSSTVRHFTRADANSSAHYLVGQDGEIVQFVNEADTAWHARGANRRSVGIEHVAVKQGGATYGATTFPYMPPTDIQYSESAALVSYLCQKYGLPVNRTTIIGHREADTGTSHSSCPDGAWNWDHFMNLVTNQICAPQPTAQARAQSRALDAGGQSVEIKYRAFIPSPVIEGPNSGWNLGPIASGEDFSGDNRGFSYNQGTSRAEITATLTLNADGSMTDLRTVDRHWGESKAYDSSYTYHVEGRPDWWKDKQAGLEPSRRGTLAVSDDNLRIAPGASGLQRSILATTSNSVVVSIHMAGALPLISPSPDIDADIAIYLKPGPTGVQAMVVGDHDGFPCHELYINGQAIHTYDPVAAGNSPSSLLPPTDQEFSTSWIDLPARAGATAQALDADDWSINWDEVYPIPQPTDMSCWATAAAMIVGWRDNQCVSPELLARFNGCAPSLTTGLLPSAKRAFADAIGLVVHPNACYTPEGFRDILEANGPIWVTADVPGIHAIVVTGMYRENGQYFVRVTDPWDRVVGSPGAPGAYAATHNTGSQYIMTYDAFEAEFEAAGNIDRIQLLHTGGAHGHVINRGSAVQAGYAQALDAKDARTGAPDERLGIGTNLTRSTEEKGGCTYDLAALSGMVRPSNALAGGAGTPPIAGEHIVLDDWPYIPGTPGATKAPVAIDWQYQAGPVGNVVITALDPQTCDGWTARVRADIEESGSSPDFAQLRVRVTTTFVRAGEPDQVAVSDVFLLGNGRHNVVHASDRPQPAQGSTAGGALTPSDRTFAPAY